MDFNEQKKAIMCVIGLQYPTVTQINHPETMKAGLPMAKLGEYLLIISKSGYIFSNTDIETLFKR